MKETNKNTYIVGCISLSIYIGMLMFIYFCIFRNPSVGNIINSGELLSSKIFNLVPFKNITNYALGWFNNTINTDIVFSNLLAPIIIWFPSGIFGFYFLEKFKLSKQIIGIIVVLVIVFSLRVVFRIGYFDIDKIILGASSYLISYKLVQFSEKNKGYLQQHQLNSL